jgi:transposase
MLSVASTARVYLYMQAVDMRRSYDGLHAIVQSEFTRDIRLGDYFMFINRRRDRIKIIWWDKDGLAIFMKRLESGSIQRPTADGNSKSLIIDHAELSMLLDTKSLDATELVFSSGLCVAWIGLRHDETDAKGISSGT